MTRTQSAPLLLAIAILAPAARAHAQSAPPAATAAALLEEIDTLKDEVARLTTELQDAPLADRTTISVSATSTLIIPPRPRPAMTLGAAAEQAARIQHAWPLSDNSVPPGRPAVVAAAAPPAAANGSLVQALAAVLANFAAAAPAAAPVAQSETDRIDEYRRVAKKDEAYWKDRRRDLQSTLDVDEIHLGAMLSRVRQLTDDFNGAESVAERAVLRRELEVAHTEATRLRAAVIGDKRVIDTLEEEARRADVPPGWLRP